MYCVRFVKNKEKQNIFLVLICLCLLMTLLYYNKEYEKLLNRMTKHDEIHDIPKRDPRNSNTADPGPIEKGVPEYPSLHKECFIYENLTARFNCSGAPKYRKFDADLISKCVLNHWEKSGNVNQVDPWKLDLNNASKNSDYVALWKRPAIHWVFSGDSHIRNVFEVLVRRLAGPRVKYRLAGYPLSRWEATEEMIKNFGRMKHDLYHQVMHLDYPLKLTHNWQPLWLSIENNLKDWNAGNMQRPSRLIFGGIMHFMIKAGPVFLAEGPEKAVVNFTKVITRMAPLLKDFTRNTPTIYKLSDHVQKCEFNTITNNDNIDLHNRIARRVLNGTGVKLWDSAIPLSDINNEECRLRYKESKNGDKSLAEWRCQDKRHMGYTFIDQYIDMILNEICSDILV